MAFRHLVGLKNLAIIAKAIYDWRKEPPWWAEFEKDLEAFFTLCTIAYKDKELRGSPEALKKLRIIWLALARKWPSQVAKFNFHKEVKDALEKAGKSDPQRGYREFILPLIEISAPPEQLMKEENCTPEQAAAILKWAVRYLKQPYTKEETLLKGGEMRNEDQPLKELKTEREYALAALALGAKALRMVMTLTEYLAERGVLSENDIERMAARNSIRYGAFASTFFDEDQWEQIHKISVYVDTKVEEAEREMQGFVQETLRKRGGERK